MKLTGFLTLKAVISTFLGIALILVPVPLMSIYGAALDSSGALMAQMAGASLLGIGLICWFNKNADSQVLSGVTLSLFIADGIGFVVVLMGMLSGQMSALGWMTVALYLLFTLGMGYFRFMKSDVLSPA